MPIVMFSPDADYSCSYLRRSGVKLASAAGIKTEKHVPERFGWRLLQKRIEPPTRSTMPLHSHNPSPVPLSPFVVKKGSKSRAWFSGSIPLPVSATEMQ